MVGRRRAQFANQSITITMAYLQMHEGWKNDSGKMEQQNLLKRRCLTKTHDKKRKELSWSENTSDYKKCCVL